MRSITLLLAVAVVLAVPGLVRAEDAAEAVEPHTDQQLADHEVFKKFEAKYASDDMDDRLRILRWFGMWRHKKVVKELTKVWLKEADCELKAVAAEGLGRQLGFEKLASKALVKGLEMFEEFATKDEPTSEEELQQAHEARALVAGIQAMGALGRTRYWEMAWKQLKGFIDHPHDDVASAMMIVCGQLKEYKALPILLEWFNYYPDGYSWSGGSVKVDTGAAGTKDARAAKAKWKAKFGSRAKKARPLVWEKMVEALELITGVKFEKPKEVEAWMKENKLLLRKHGV